MRIEILPTSKRSFRGVVQYNLKKDSELISMENCLGDSADHLLGYLQKITDRSSRIRHPVFHGCISMAYDESDMPEELVKEIARDYMKSMGYGDQPYGLFKHTDKKHIHYHIISSRVDIHSGRKINDSNERRRTLTVLIDLIKKYNLSHQVMETEQGLVHEVNKAMNLIMKNRPHSLLAFSGMCKEAEFNVVKTKRGVVFYKTDETNGKQRGINSSLLEIFQNKSLDKRLKSNCYYRNIAKLETIAIIDKSLRQNIHQKEYRDLLYQAGVQFKLHRNSAGVFGVSYKMNGFVFNGSDLGAGYSWANLKSKIVLAEPKQTFNPVGRIRTPIARGINTDRGAGLYIGTLHGVDKDEDDEDERIINNDSRK